MTVRKIAVKWFVDFRFHHADGRVERVRKASPVQAKAGAAEYERQLRTSMIAPAPARKEDAPTFAAFAAEFMATYAKTNNKPSEQHAKEKNLRLYLLPSLGRIRLDQMTARDVEKVKAAMVERGLGAKTVNNALACLSKILQYARENDVIATAPKVKFLRVPPQPYDFLSDDELDRLLEACARSNPHHRAMLLVAADAGLRRGEIVALEWGDVDFHNRTLTVRRSVWKNHVGSPKGGRERKLPMTDRLMEALRAIRHLRGDRIFCHDDGTPLTSPSIEATLRYATRRAGLRRIGWHVLRHTFCSRLAAAGAPPKAVQELAGHATMQMTLRYMHLAPSTLRDAVALLDRSGGQQMGNGGSARA